MADDKIDLNVPRVAQSNSKVCWHASYKMMYKWNSRPASAVDKKWPNPGKAGTDTEKGLKPSQWRKAGAIMGLGSIDASSLKSIDSIFWALKNWGPLWTTGKFGRGGASMHTIVIGGARRKSRQLLILDPWELYVTMGDTRWTHISWWERLVDSRNYSCQTWMGA